MRVWKTYLRLQIFGFFGYQFAEFQKGNLTQGKKYVNLFRQKKSKVNFTKLKSTFSIRKYAIVTFVFRDVSSMVEDQSTFQG